MERLEDLANLLRQLRRRHARRQGGAELSYRELAAATGWSHGVIGGYLAGTILPPTDRFDVLTRLLGATPAEQGALATARDQVEERRRRPLPTGGRVADVPVQRQLPPRVSGFTGRVHQLAQLDALLAEGERTASVMIAAVSGTAGVGKTALAVSWAHRIADRFPDGQLYIDLRGYDADEPLPPADALAGFLRGLGVRSADLPDDVARRAAWYRSLLADRRMLVLLDHAASAEQVRPLLPGGPASLVVVTSRNALAGLVARDGARRIDLDVLSAADAMTLLRALVGGRVDDDPVAAGILAERCSRLPLALRVAAELAVANPAMPLADLVADLGDEQRRLDVLGAPGDRRSAVRTVFSWSYRHLTPAAARAFGLLGLNPACDVDVYAVAALAGTGLDEARALTGELSRAHLIEPAGPGLYTMHDLLRAYAAECAAETGAEGDCRAALSRLFDFYTHTAAVAMDTVFPHERGNRPEVPPVRTPVPVLDQPELATRWLDRQRDNLVAVAVHAAAHGWPRHCVDLSRVLWRHFEVGGHYQEALTVHSNAERAARDSGTGIADVLANLGGIHWWLGRYQQARSCLERSVAEHRSTANADGEARALARLGLVHERLGDYHEALAYLSSAVTGYRRTGNRHGEAGQLLNVGALYRRLGRYAEAIDHQRRAAAIFAELADARLEGYALGNLGAVESLLGRHPEALDHLRAALTKCREANDPGGEGSALSTIGAIHRRAGRLAEALDHLHRALAISRQTGDRGLETETLNALGETLRDMGEPDAALARHRAALTVTQQTGERYEHARALDGIAAALRATGRPTRAEEFLRRALDLYAELRVPEADQVRPRLAG